MFKKLSAVAACVVLAAVTTSIDAIAADHQGSVARGRTGQGRGIRVKVMSDHIRLLGFSIELNCSGGYLLVDQESGFEPTAVSHGGRLRDRQYGSTDEVLVRGRLQGRTVRGQIRVRDRLGKHRCSSPWVSFHARARG
jgi:hypothetical protein